MTIAYLALALLASLYGFRVGNSRFDITRYNSQDVYLQRWWLFGGKAKGSLALMLHHFLRPDEDECHHDHPWNFWTLVLWGGYTELVTVQPGEEGYNRTGWVSPDERALMVRVVNRPGTLRYRPATHTHRVERLLNGRSCWTLVLRTKERRTWGFHTQRGWVKWDLFIKDAVAWCRGE